MAQPPPSAPIALKPNGGALLHRQLSMLLRQQIASGILRSDEQLPTQEALCRQYSVSRITVRRALADLQAEGLVRNVQGVGSFVASSGAAAPGIASASFLGEMNSAYQETSMHLVSLAHERCPLPVIRALRLGADEDAMHVVRIRSLKQAPVMLLDAWIPLAHANAVSASNLKRRPLYELVSGGPEHLGRVGQEINAALAEPRVAQALGIDVNAPVLKLDRLIHDRRGAPIELLTIWSSPLRSSFVMEIPADALDTDSAGGLQHRVLPDSDD